MNILRYLSWFGSLHDINGLVHSPHTYCTIRNVHIRTFEFKSFMNHTTAPANYGRIVWMNSIQLVWFLLLFALWFDFLLKQSNIYILRILFFMRQTVIHITSSGKQITFDHLLYLPCLLGGIQPKLLFQVKTWRDILDVLHIALYNYSFIKKSKHLTFIILYIHRMRLLVLHMCYLNSSHSQST